MEASAPQYIESPHILTYIYIGTVTIHYHLSITLHKKGCPPKLSTLTKWWPQNIKGYEMINKQQEKIQIPVKKVQMYTSQTVSNNNTEKRR